MDIDNLIGTTLSDHYKIIRKLGSGGMGAVYKGHDLSLDRTVAVKVMRSDLAQQQNVQQRFRQEARALAKLEHPGIVKVHDYGQHQDTLYIVMQFVAGDNLSELLNRLRSTGKWLPLSQALQIVRQVCEAVDYVHQQGVLHRDLKPANIMMKKDSSRGQDTLQPLLTDLGLAKLIGGGLETQAGISMGTPAYMSPEQALGEDTDARSDVYSLGILLYELTVGRLPFQINSWSDAIRCHTKELPPPPRTVNPNLSDWVEKAILKALKKNPAERFASAAKLAEALAYVEPRVPGHSVPPIAAAGAENIGTLYQASVLNQPPDPPSLPLPTSRAHLDDIVVIAPNKSKHTIEIKERALIIGRGRENDLVLDTDKVSRKHAKIEFDGTEYRVTDLNSRNKTFLNRTPFLPGISETWQPGQWLYIGGYWLLLRKGDETNEPVPPTPPPPSGEIVTQTEPVEVKVQPAQVKLTPGSPTIVTVIITNHQAETDRFSLSTLDSLPKQWLLNPQTQVTVAGQSSQPVQLTLQPPRSPQASLGPYQLQLQVVSQRDSSNTASTSCTVTVDRFTAFTSEVGPERVRPKQPVTLTLHNQGNALETFQVRWKDPNNELFFEAAQRKLSLKPGEKGIIKFTVTPQQARLVGDEVRSDFTTEVSLEGGESRPHPGVLVSKGLVPKWASVLGVILILLVGLGIIGWWVSKPRIDGITVTPNPVIVGESVAVKVDAFGVWSDIRVNGTPALSGELAYQIEPGSTGEQVINIELADFLGRKVTKNVTVMVAPAMTNLTLIPEVTVTASPPSTGGNGSGGGSEAPPSGTEPPGEPPSSPGPETPNENGTSPIAGTMIVTAPIETVAPITLAVPVSTNTPTPTSTALASTNTPIPTDTPTSTPTLTPSPTPTCNSWNLASDIRPSPNQENPNHDACGNSNVWHFMQSSSRNREPQSYSLLSNFISNGHDIQGLEQWYGDYPTDKLPAIGINNTGAIQLPLNITLLPHTVYVHPSPNQLIVVGWHSSINGVVKVTGLVRDADSNCGDGISWFIDKGNTNLASGDFNNGGAQDFGSGTGGSSMNNISVNQNDFIYFIVHPKSDHICDTTQLDVSITVVR